MKNNWIVSDEDQNQRLDRFLVAHVHGLSRSSLQKAIENGQVTVNGEGATKHRFLKAGDAIVVSDTLFEVVKTIPWWEAAPSVDVRIVFEDDTICVVEKPIDIVMHPVHENDIQPSMAAWFIQKMGGIDAIAEVFADARTSLRPGIVHRLDKHVGGVVVLAKTQAALDGLKTQFEERTVEKEYRAVVYGVPSQEAGDIRFVLTRSVTQEGKMAARPEHEEGKAAWTEYDVLENIHDRYAYVSVRIHTGRTHQIRAHLAAIDHPIVGDHLYASKKYPVFKKSKHLFLVAHTLAFRHPITQERLSFEVPIPEWFQAFEGVEKERQ